MNEKITAGILAHVDAGKTTLSESLLLHSGVIRKAGRVDKGDAFLDTDSLEKERGITIYTKNARLPISSGEWILIDTPGHVDFSAEMERALSVMDYAILLISGPSGVQSHTKTLWSLLRMYQIPTVLFVNKMDMEGCDAVRILEEIHAKLSDDAVSFTDMEKEGYPRASLSSIYEDIATASEALMNEYLESGSVSKEGLLQAFERRELFPVFFGSALKQEGTEDFYEAVQELFRGRLAKEDDFSARVYKISHDQSGKRLTYLRLFSGSLKVKEQLGDEKINEIRIYSGDRYEAVSEVGAGDICAIPGLLETHAGDVLGKPLPKNLPTLIPAISYAVHFPKDYDIGRVLEIFRELEDEDPSLNVEYREQTREIHVSLMGDIQTEVLKRTLLERYQLPVSFGEGKICYKETIAESDVGVGHFEPLRHYAEVQLLLEPAERGSGLSFETNLPEDILARNWQRLIMTHLMEREHRGVLTGSPITDMKLTLVAGRAHQKHTEGGDFRQATYRAIRQGLMCLRARGACHLLEPYYDYTLKVPEAYVGRAMTDITQMPGSCEIAENDYEGGLTILVGRAPVSAMNGYSKEITAYTRGLGELSFSVSGYDICHNEEEVLAGNRYDPEADLRNPASSVFCSHGAGTVIPWDEVDAYKHLEYADGQVSERAEQEAEEESARANKARRRFEIEGTAMSVEEVDAILHASSHANAQGRQGAHKGISAALREHQREKKTIAASAPLYKGKAAKEPYLLVDGYNVIHAWEELSDVMSVSLDGAAGKLNDILCNYQAITGVHLIVVYDAYKVKGHSTEEKKYHNITVVYTKESQTADQYIERYAHENASKYDITVVTSDGLEQIIIRGAGALLVSSREFEEQVQATFKEFNDRHGVL